ncbi:hypothetical protein GTP46_02695 [Duganella sp. FT135W]|uniref:Uncharacterized protein n=1 Tax=Duganella flavida TaxID=2692175 RepID=A0A6L8K6Q2_9BURK|nr:hypothetical protein [Duganella flavida]MYM21554.1 hypothetical protein [Duganella flavida]
MHATELRLIQLARQIGGVAQQAALAYEQAQAGLQLGRLFTLESVATTEGTRQALDIVDRLTELHQAHQQMFAKFVPAMMQQISEAIAALPAEKVHEYEQGLIPSLNTTLAGQAEFYANRDRWIAAVREMFAIVDRNRDVISFDDGQILFHDDDVIDRYEAAQQVINDIHEYEVAHMQEKAARAMAASAYLAALENGAAQ